MSAVPIIIASQNATADSSLLFYNILTFILCLLVLFICSLTIIYGGKNKDSIEKEKIDEDSKKTLD